VDVLMDSLVASDLPVLTGHFDVEHSTFQFELAGHAAHEHTRT
jgi:hypothetical protein